MIRQRTGNILGKCIDLKILRKRSNETYGLNVGGEEGTS